MNNFFLPREVGSIETGPQIFTQSNTPNTTFYFEITPDNIPGILNSVNVANCGLGILNGVFNYTTELDGKPYYNKDNSGNLFIIWFDNMWGIYDFNINSNPIYSSTEDVLYPWLVTNWVVLNSIYNPLPTVTRIT